MSQKELMDRKAAVLSELQSIDEELMRLNQVQEQNYTHGSTVQAGRRRSPKDQYEGVECTDADKTHWNEIQDTQLQTMNECANLDSSCTSIFSLDSQCVADCVEKKMGLSKHCARAFGVEAECGFKYCKMQCISGDLTAKNCVECNEKKCTKDFYTYSGLEPHCIYRPDCDKN